MAVEAILKVSLSKCRHVAQLLHTRPAGVFHDIVDILAMALTGNPKMNHHETNMKRQDSPKFIKDFSCLMTAYMILYDLFIDLMMFYGFVWF